MRGLIHLALVCGAVADLDSFLATLKGATDVDCQKVCDAAGGAYQGYGMSSSGEVATWGCTCGGVTVNVACTGSPFIQCCKDKCAGSGCGDKVGGWTCPANGGCAVGTCSGDGDWADWVGAFNVYRCMHDVPPLSWSEPMYTDIKGHFGGMSQMVHSDCYGLKPPAGPAGENLFQGTGNYNAMDAVHAWQTEIKECGPFPGCTVGSKGTTGHFTAQMWNGAQFIGCQSNANKLYACRFKAHDYLSCNTPNYGDDASYAQNLFAPVKSYSECVAAVKACGLPAADPLGGAPDASTGLSLLPAGIWARPAVASSSMGFIVSAFIAGSLVGMFMHRRFKRSSRNPVSQDESSLHLVGEQVQIE